MRALQDEPSVTDHRDLTAVRADSRQQADFLIGDRDIRMAAEIRFFRFRIPPE